MYSKTKSSPGMDPENCLQSMQRVSGRLAGAVGAGRSTEVRAVAGRRRESGSSRRGSPLAKQSHTQAVTLCPDGALTRPQTSGSLQTSAWRRGRERGGGRQAGPAPAATELQTAGKPLAEPPRSDWPPLPPPPREPGRAAGAAGRRWEGLGRLREKRARPKVCSPLGANWLR